MYHGDGNVALITPIVARLVARGHFVRVLAGPGVRPTRLPISGRFLARLSATGATIVPFAQPAVHPLDEPPSPRDPMFGWTPKVIQRIENQAVPYRWSESWAENVTSELRREPANVVAADFILVGALAAAEAANVPAVALVHATTYPFPAHGLPAFGYGFLPARSPVGWLRDALANAATRWIVRRHGLPWLNRARRRLGLPGFRSPFTQYDRAARVLILASAAFDFSARSLPSNVRYVGTPIDDVGACWNEPWLSADDRPLVLVSLSTLPQGQADVLRRILVALDGLTLRALVTLGPALSATSFNPPPNTRLEVFVPHSAVLPRAAALVTQCGLGTVTKALAHGVPMVCIPLVGDQPDNAARVVARGAGVLVDRAASRHVISQALWRVLNEPRFRANAGRLAVVLANVDAPGAAVAEIESVVGAT
jgi:UDP:flavonoid glycosyltransferase YjiC (YdhE family)